MASYLIQTDTDICIRILSNEVTSILQMDMKTVFEKHLPDCHIPQSPQYESP
jgi:hypothetical protein